MSIRAIVFEDPTGVRFLYDLEFDGKGKCVAGCRAQAVKHAAAVT